MRPFHIGGGFLLLLSAAFWYISQPDIPAQSSKIPMANRLLLHIAPRSLIVDGLNSAIVHKDIITDEMIDRYWDFIRMDGTREATITRGRIRDNRIRDDIPNIKTPTLILWGEDDRTIPVEAAYAFHAAIAGSKLVVYANTGHVPQEEVADQSAADVRAFLSGAVITLSK